MKEFLVPEMTILFVNENLTHYRKKLFWSIKRAAKANNYQVFVDFKQQNFCKERR